METILFIVLLSYLIGSIPTAYLIAKINHFNIFEIGSGNMGATNISRILGVKWGLIVWFLDSMKGVAAILLSRRLMLDSPATATTIAAIVAVIGHNWSLIVALLTGSLRGGKGAATAFGTLIMVAPAQMLIVVFAISGACIVITRYMSFGVLVLFGMSMVWMLVLVAQQQMDAIFTVYSVLLMVIIVFRFRDNIQRLLAGTERRLGEGA